VKPKTKILIIAGSDSSGGAGIQADIKTTSALGGYAMTAVTAITSQNTTGVKSIVPIPPQEIYNQIIFTAKDIKPNAIKIGMLHSTSVINSVIKALKKIKVRNIVLDPVMVAKGGTRLINTNSINLLKKKILSYPLIITPNIPEAEVLTETRINNLEDMIKAGSMLLDMGVKNVLIKGGHLNSKVLQDVFLSKKKFKIFKNKKIFTKNTHGTGCTLSSAIATYLGCGKPLIKACELSIKYVNQAISSNIKFGKGHGPINHLVSLNLKREFN